MVAGMKRMAAAGVNSSTITLHVTVLQLEMKGEWRAFAKTVDEHRG